MQVTRHAVQLHAKCMGNFLGRVELPTVFIQAEPYTMHSVACAALASALSHKPCKHTFVVAEQAYSGHNNCSSFLCTQQELQYKEEQGTECYLVFLRWGLTSSEEGS